jgi:hypothetical protein
VSAGSELLQFSLRPAFLLTAPNLGDIIKAFTQSPVLKPQSFLSDRHGSFCNLSHRPPQNLLGVWRAAPNRGPFRCGTDIAGVLFEVADPLNKDWGREEFVFRLRLQDARVGFATDLVFY